MFRFALVLAAATLLAQECRITAVTPAQPPFKVSEGETATESETFQTGVFALSPTEVPYFFDSVNRIRRIDAGGRIFTVAGNGQRALTLDNGPALQTGLPAIGQILFSPDGVLHFTALGRVWKLNGGQIEAIAGSGRPGFNGESGPALDVSLGGIVNAAFAYDGTLLILDGYARVRMLRGGEVVTVAGSTRTAAAAGFTGDNGPATEAALNSPRQIFPLRDGSVWIKDLAGRHIRIFTIGGDIRTINQNFEPTVNIISMADGTPSAATANRVYPIRANGAIETGAAPYPPFTGTPLAIGPSGALFFLGSARPNQRNPLVRIAAGRQTVLASAPIAATVDGQGPPYALWLARNSSLLYSATLGDKTGILELRPGQSPRFIVGGGDDVGDPDGKQATSMIMYGILAFTVDGAGRIIVADVYRRRILIVETDGKIGVLKQGSDQYVYAPLGSLSTLQRIAADNAGNVYWFSEGQPATTTTPFQGKVAVWNRASSTISDITVPGLAFLSRLEDGSVMVISGNGTNFRSAWRLTPNGRDTTAPLEGLRYLPLNSLTRVSGVPYYTAASRLFRNAPGAIEMLDVQYLPNGAVFQPDFALSTPAGLFVRSTGDGGFHRIDNPNACAWMRQPLIQRNGIVNAASFEFENAMSPRQLLTIFGSGLGPAEGQGLVLDGVLRAGGQPAPYPALVLGNFSGNIPEAAVTGTAMPVVHSNDKQVTVQAVTTVPASGEYMLYFSWQGIQIFHPDRVRAQAAAPGLFTTTGTSSGPALAFDAAGARISAENPAERGGLVQLFGTGFGGISSNVALGDFFLATTPVTLTAEIEVLIDGQAAEIQWAGGAQGQISGVNELHVRVPDSVEPGERPIVIRIGQVISTQRVTIAVK